MYRACYGIRKLGILVIEDVVKELGYLSLGTRLKRLGETLQAQSQAVLAAHGFEQPAAYFPLLAALHRLGPLSVGELSQAVGAPMATSNSPTYGQSNSSMQDERIMRHRR